MNKIKYLLVFVFIFTLSIFQFTFSKSRWVKVGDNWKYELHENGGDYVTEKWRGIYDPDGFTERVYYFDYNGNMVTGPVVIDGALYVYSENGDAVTTGFEIDGVLYQTDGRGKVLGLPQFFDLSRFNVAVTAGVVFNQNLGQPITSFDEAITAPTADSE